MRTYFSEHNVGWSMTKADILEHMREYDIEQIKVIEAIPMTDSDCFLCRAYRELRVKPPEGEPCGKSYEEYEPRNGKWGICKHYGKTYEEGQAFMLHSDGRLIKLSDS